MNACAAREGTRWQVGTLARGKPLRGHVGKVTRGQGVVLGRDAVAPLPIGIKDTRARRVTCPYRLINWQLGAGGLKPRV